MLRVRFHGRGGHGMKTASRILGTAAFLEGFSVQDSPVYGAERRGAPIAAFTRISPDPVLERGVITRPDLVLIADDSLLEDPAAHCLQGVSEETVVFLNARGKAAELKDKYQISGHVASLDVTQIALDLVGKAILSAGVGAVACRLSGLLSEDKALEAVRQELHELELPEDLISKNAEAAQCCYQELPADVTAKEGPAVVAAVQQVIVPTYQDAWLGTPSVAAPGNIVQRTTGGWRTFRPVIDMDLCNQCWICFVRCPEGAINLDAKDNPHVDYDHCKGCLICVEECPTKAILKEREKAA